MKNIIKKRLKYHEKEYLRYKKEWENEIKKIKIDKGIIAPKIYNQIKYSYEKSARELSIIDELNFLLKKTK